MLRGKHPLTWSLLFLPPAPSPPRPGAVRLSGQVDPGTDPGVAGVGVGVGSEGDSPLLRPLPYRGVGEVADLRCVLPVEESPELPGMGLLPKHLPPQTIKHGGSSPDRDL